VPSLSASIKLTRCHAPGALWVLAFAAIGLLASPGCSGGSSTSSVGIHASASLSPSEVTIGVPVRYEVNVEYPKGMSVEIEDTADVLQDFEIDDSGWNVKRLLRNGRAVELRWCEFAAFSPGEHVVRWPAITYTDESSPDEPSKSLPGVPLVLHVVSVMGEAAADVRGIKPPLDIPSNRLHWLLAGASAVALLIVIAALSLIRRRKSKVRVPPPLPHEAALAEIDRLAGTSPASWEEMREFHHRLSLCVRLYIESRFGVHAPHQTTQEFLLSLAGSDQVLGAQAELLRRFLYHCDVVKFARYFPAPDELKQSLTIARRFVEETKRVPEAVACAEADS